MVAILLFAVGFTFVAAESIRIKRTDILAVTDDGRPMVTDDGRTISFSRECRIV